MMQLVPDGFMPTAVSLRDCLIEGLSVQFEMQTRLSHNDGV